MPHSVLQENTKTYLESVEKYISRLEIMRDPYLYKLSRSLFSALTKYNTELVFTPDPALKIPITNLKMDATPKNALARAGYKDLGEIVSKLTIHDLDTIKGFGKVGKEQLLSILDELDYKLEDAKPEPRLTEKEVKALKQTHKKEQAISEQAIKEQETKCHVTAEEYKGLAKPLSYVAGLIGYRLIKN